MLWSTLLLAFRAIRRNVAALVAHRARHRDRRRRGDRHGDDRQRRDRAGRRDISSLGDLLLFVPGHEPRRPAARAPTRRRSRCADVEAIQREVPGVDAVAPTANTPVTADLRQRQLARRTSPAPRRRTSPSATRRSQRGPSFDRGRGSRGQRVCILGETVREELFGRAIRSARRSGWARLVPGHRRRSSRRASRASDRTRTTSCSCRCARCQRALAGNADVLVDLRLGAPMGFARRRCRHDRRGADARAPQHRRARRRRLPRDAT